MAEFGVLAVLSALVLPVSAARSAYDAARARSARKARAVVQVNSVVLRDPNHDRARREALEALGAMLGVHFVV